MQPCIARLPSKVRVCTLQADAAAAAASKKAAEQDFEGLKAQLKEQQEKVCAHVHLHVRVAWKTLHSPCRSCCHLLRF